MDLTDQQYKDDWAAVQAEVEALYAERRWGPLGKVMTRAIDTTSDPAGKSPEELENIANYHDSLTGGACDCDVCLAVARLTGALS